MALSTFILLCSCYYHLLLKLFHQILFLKTVSIITHTISIYCDLEMALKYHLMFQVSFYLFLFTWYFLLKKTIHKSNRQ